MQNLVSTVVGRIEKEIDGEIKPIVLFVLMLFQTEQDADELMLKKSQMFIDLNGRQYLANQLG
ncbi:HlyU family transcriptional regulator [Vibrio lentus]|nr:HlyU family transcriptional regulator [Vibrio lentus]